MTAPFEIEEPEPVPIDRSHLVRTPCVRGCGAHPLAVPSQLANALCSPCRVAEAQQVATIQRLPAETPPPMDWVGSEKILAHDGSERAELIPPEFVCDEVCVHDRPGPVRDLLSWCVDNGWMAVIRHSRGRAMGLNGKQLGVADMWTVRFRQGGWMGYAARRGAEWDSVCVMGRELPPFLKLGVTQLKTWLADPDRPASWYAEITQAKAEQAAAQKARAKVAAATRGTKRIDHAD